MNKQIVVKTVETLPDGSSIITYADYHGKTHTQKACLCSHGETYTGFGDEKFLILTFENVE